MREFFKKLISSKWVRMVLSIVLICFAFRKVDIFKLVGELRAVPVWVVAAMLVFMGFTMWIGAVRWALLVLPHPKVKDYWVFLKATYLGAFYGLFFPSAVGGDLVKWVSLLERYPELSKTKLAGSVLVDRAIGFTAFVVMGLIALILGKIWGYQFPPVLMWLFMGLNMAVGVFYMLVFTIDFEKFFGKFRFMNKIIQIVDLLKNENKNRIIKCFLISVVAEPVWQLTFWFNSLVFKAGISLLQVYIFVPVISLILVLPISVAGFGARENLFLYFFSQLGIADEKILMVSTFGGIMAILNSALGGLWLLVGKGNSNNKNS